MPDQAIALIEKLTAVIDKQRSMIATLEAKVALHDVVITRVLETNIMGGMDAEARADVETLIAVVLQIARTSPERESLENAAEMLRYGLTKPGRGSAT